MGAKQGIIFHNAQGGLPGEKEKDMTTIKIKGMTCRHCVMAVTKALGDIDGIRDVQVDLEKGEAAFTDGKPIDRALIRERIVKAGFDVAD
jgi:copper chaperone